MPALIIRCLKISNGGESYLHSKVVGGHSKRITALQIIFRCATLRGAMRNDEIKRQLRTTTFTPGGVANLFEWQKLPLNRQPPNTNIQTHLERDGRVNKALVGQVNYLRCEE